jgi:hypothetical protein
MTNDVTLVDDISRSITEDHFTDPTNRSLYRLITTYRQVAGGLLPASAVEQFTAKSADTGSAALLRELHAALVDDPVPADVTRWQARELRSQRELRLTQMAFRDSSDILSGSITEEVERGRVRRTLGSGWLLGSGRSTPRWRSRKPRQPTCCSRARRF